MISELAEKNPVGLVALIIFGFFGGFAIVFVLYLILFSGGWPETKAYGLTWGYQGVRGVIHPQIEFSYYENSEYHIGTAVLSNCPTISKDITEERITKFLARGAMVKYSPITPVLYRLVVSCP